MKYHALVLKKRKRVGAAFTSLDNDVLEVGRGQRGVYDGTVGDRQPIVGAFVDFGSHAHRDLGCQERHEFCVRVLREYGTGKK